MIKTTLIILLCGCLPALALAQTSDTTVVHDLSDDWVYYNYSHDSYLPLVNKFDFEGTSLHFIIDAEQHANSWFWVRSSQSVSIFIDDRLAEVVQGSVFWKTDSLAKVFGQNKIRVSLYQKELNPMMVTTQLVTTIPLAMLRSPLSDQTIIVRQRASDAFNDFFIVALLLLGVGLALIFHFHRRYFVDFYKVSKAFSLRDSDENLLKNKPITRINILFYILLSFIAALLMIGLVHFSGAKVDLAIFRPESFWGSIWKWTELSLLIMTWFFVKYIIISSLASLFRLTEFLSSHFINYIRMSLFIYTFGIVMLLLVYYMLHIDDKTFYYSMVNMLLILMGIRLVIIFFKLLQSSSYKLIHLFSYLCGTEIIAFIVILSLILNQPF